MTTGADAAVSNGVNSRPINRGMRMVRKNAGSNFARKRRKKLERRGLPHPGRGRRRRRHAASRAAWLPAAPETRTASSNITMRICSAPAKNGRLDVAPTTSTPGNARIRSVSLPRIVRHLRRYDSGRRKVKPEGHRVRAVVAGIKRLNPAKTLHQQCRPTSSTIVNAIWVEPASQFVANQRRMPHAGTA